ncbi:MAG: hypothetical protein LUI05_06810 [Oscillospiraceae bacterium]|nr:hypothetical protein [Oscillospiraceae bacterium]
MALYGISAYMSNTYYTSLFSNSNKNSSTTNSTSDLYALMQKVDQVRSVDYQKSMIEEYKKAFSNSDVGTVESELNLSSTAKDLSSSAATLASSDFSDSESLLDNVQAFVDDYNSVVDSLQKSESVDALRKGLYMTNTAKAYSGALGRIGIKVGSDNKLTIDEETLQSADTRSVKSILSGNYSFTSKVADKASDISRAAGLKAQVVSYTSTGTLDYSTMLSLTSIFSESI